MPKIALDLFHGTSKKTDTTLELNDLPQFNLRYYSDNPDNVYICNDTEYMEFFTNINYIVEVEVLNEAVGTTVSLEVQGQWLVVPEEGLLWITDNGTTVAVDTMELSSGTTTPVPYNSMSRIDGAPHNMVTVTPLSEGKTQSNGRARFRVNFANRPDQHLNGFRSYRATFKVSTSRGTSNALNTYTVSYNPASLSKGNKRTVFATAPSYAPDFIDIPVGQYGTWVDIIVIGPGGGASTPNGTSEETILRPSPGESPGGSGTDMGFPGYSNYGGFIHYYDRTRSNYVNNKGYQNAYPFHPDRYATYSRFVVTGGEGGRKMSPITLNGLAGKAWEIPYATTPRYEDEVYYPAHDPIDGTGPHSKHVRITIEKIAMSDGAQGTATAGGTSPHHNPVWPDFDGVLYGAGGEPKQLAAFTGDNRSIGGGSGGYVKYRISIRRKATAKNIPLPPLTLSWISGVGTFGIVGLPSRPICDGGASGTQKWTGGVLFDLNDPDPLTLIPRTLEAWNNRYGTNPKPEAGRPACIGIFDFGSFTSYI